MKFHRLIDSLRLVLTVGLCSATVAGQSASPHQNAAMWYQRAFAQLQKLSPEQRQLLVEWDYAGGAPPSAQLRAALASVQPLLQTIQRGAGQEYSDFALDFTQGAELLLPHLAPLRDIATMARTDAMVRLHDGDSAGAADRLASLYRMAGHGGDDHTLISSLVGQAIFGVADQAAQMALDGASFNADDGAKLLSSMQQFNVDDPFNYGESIAAEQEFVIDWAATKFAGEDGPAQFAEFMGTFAPGSAMEQIALLDEAGFANALDQHGQLLNQAVEIFSLPDEQLAKAELARLQDEVVRGEHGLIAMGVAPAFSKILERKFEAQRRIAERLETYGKLSTAQAMPDEMANAAVWYLRGIELLAKIDPKKLGEIAPAADADDRNAHPERDAALQEAQAAIDVFRDGSLIKRCDFTLARRTTGTRILAPHYCTGMHEALRLLRADASRLLEASDPSNAVDRLETALRVIAHLGSDPVIASTAIAHHDFNATLSLIERELKSGRLSNEIKPALMNALERLGRKDPFGYLDTTLAARKEIGDRLADQSATWSELDLHAQAARFVSDLDIDRAFYFQVVFDTMQQAAISENARARAEFEAQVPVNPLQGLEDVFAMASIDRARSDVAAIAPALLNGDFSVVTELNVPPMLQSGTLTNAMRRARGDVREAYLLLRSADAAETHSDAKLVDEE